MKSNPFSIYSEKKYRKKNHGHSLDWEESSFNEAENPEEYYHGFDLRPKLYALGFVLGAIFLFLAGRLFYLQIFKNDYYRKVADGNHVRVQAVLAPRGIIYDSQGQPLVQNVPSFELVVTPLDLPQNNYEDEVRKLAAIMKFDPDATIAEIKKSNPNSFQEISVIQGLDRDSAIVFEAQADDFPGFSVENNPVRQYADPLIFSHPLGYTGKVNDTELAAHANDNYLLNDYIGKDGLELSYDQFLRGVDGKKQVEVDARGIVKSVLGEIPATPGDSAYLNIDAGLQRFLYNDIITKNGNKKAAAVAVDPRSGKILALLSLPGFDSNLFSQKISVTDYQNLLSDGRHPLFDRAVSGTYPPGSTIKPVIASAALQEQVVTPQTKITDNGDLVVGNFHFHGWKPGGLGPMDVRSAIAMSSDIYFYTVGGGQSNLGISGLGPERLEKYDYLFGMGQKLGIDVPAENSGMIASPEWRKAHYADPAKQAWYLGDTYHESIGQGDMAVTPLQVAMWTATVANGGTLYQPYILNKVVDADGQTVKQNNPEVIRSNFIDAQNIEIVREGMRQTVTAGTARSLNTLPITSAGKTGTAQFDSANPSAAHAWFTAFAPYENPQIAITVLIEAGGEGSSASVPIVRDALQWWAQNRYGK